MYVATSYLTYLAISIALTIWVARTLHRSGRVFLLDAFHGNAPLADSVNQLLVVGFYTGQRRIYCAGPQDLRPAVELARDHRAREQQNWRRSLDPGSHALLQHVRARQGAPPVHTTCRRISP